MPESGDGSGADVAAEVVRLETDDGLTRLASHWLQACVDRDADFINEHSTDNPPHSFACIATAGSSFLLDEFTSHLQGLKKAAWAGMKLSGYRLGATAWFMGMEQGLLPWGEPLNIRITLLMIDIGGSWKVCRCHISESVDRDGVALEQ